MQTKDIDYTAGGAQCRGFLAFDETKSGKRPGVLVVHEAFGLGEHAMERARMLARLGYVAFAADMFGGRRQISALQEAIGVIGPLREDPPKLRALGRAALDVMAAQPQVDASRLGGIGFCFGGSTVLELARDGAALKGVVSFHGALNTKAPAAKGAVKSAVLACTGADDPLVPASQVVEFEEEMTKAGADWQVIAYGNTAHSFTNPEADGSMHPGIRYMKLADERSWAAMAGFFAEVFR